MSEKSDVLKEEIFFRTLYTNNKPRGRAIEFNYRVYKDWFEASLRDEVIKPFSKRLTEKFDHPQVLDVAAGNSAIPDWLAKFGIKTIRLDIVKDMIEFSSNSVQASGLRLPFKNNSVQGIVSKDLLSHIYPPYRKLLFDEFDRVLVPGGELLVITPNTEYSDEYPYQYDTKYKHTVSRLEEMGYRPQHSLWHPIVKRRDWHRGQLRHCITGSKP